MLKIIAPSTAMIAVNYAFARFSFGLFLPYIIASLSLSEQEAGYVGTMGYLSFTLALLVSSSLIKTLGTFKVTQIAGFSAVTGLAGIALASNVYILGLGVFTAGLGSGLSSPVYSRIVDQSFSDEWKDRGNSWINSGTSFGMIISGPVALLFAAYWRRAFLFFALLALVVSLWNAWAIPDFKSSKETVKKTKLTVTHLFSRGNRLILASLVTGLASAIFWTFSRQAVVVNHGFTDSTSALFWVTMGVAGIAGGRAGNLIESRGIQYAFRLFLAILNVAIMMLAAPIGWTAYLSAVLYGIAYIAVTGSLLVIGTRQFPHAPQTGVSLAFLSLGIGQTIGTSVAGLVIGWTGYPMSFLLFGLAGFSGLFISFHKNAN